MNIIHKKEIVQREIIKLIGIKETTCNEFEKSSSIKLKKNDVIPRMIKKYFNQYKIMNQPFFVYTDYEYPSFNAPYIYFIGQEKSTKETSEESILEIPAQKYLKITTIAEKCQIFVFKLGKKFGKTKN